MVKAKNFSTTTRSNFNQKKNHSQPSIKKNKLFLSLLVNDYILMYLKTTILCIYNFFLVKVFVIF